MSTPSIESGFAAPRERLLRVVPLPALIATVALSLSIAVVLAVTMSAARAAQLF